MAVLDFIINILSTPAILVGLLSLLGLVLQKKPVEDVVSGTIKTIVGFLVLSAGAAFLQSGSLLAFGELFNYAFSMQGVVPNNEAVVSMALTDFGQASAIIMALGMVLNIVLARFSRMPYIFLTGHHTLYMACMLAVVFSVGGLSGWPLYIAGACVLGLIMVLSPLLLPVHLPQGDQDRLHRSGPLRRHWLRHLRLDRPLLRGQHLHRVHQLPQAPYLPA